MTRFFLGWDRPLCETVPEHLLRQADRGLLDLRDTVVIVPTRQSSWRLRAALPLAGDSQDTVCIGPEIVTPPVLLAPVARAGTASDLQSLLVWTSVLKSVQPGEFAAFLGTAGKHPGGTAWALQIARQLQNLRQELADGGLTLSAVADADANLEEAERWAAMKELENRYLAQLRSLALRDAIADKVDRAQNALPPKNVTRVVVAAVPDPPKLLERLLERWAEAGIAVEILVAAPAKEADAFDTWGRPLPERWSAREIRLNDADLWLEAAPDDQALRIAQAVEAARAVQTHPDSAQPQFAVGVPDREVAAPLQRALADSGIPAFDPQNRPFSETPLFRLVQALLNLRGHNGYAEVAGLLRHPDVLLAVGDGADALRKLDAFQTEYLPVSLDDLCEREAAGTKRETAQPPLEALARIRTWRESLRKDGVAAGLREVLQHIYAKRMLRSDHPDDAAFRQSVSALDAVLREWEVAAPTDLTEDDRTMVLLARLREASVKAERRGEILDLEGWLELAWNPAPLLFVAGMNEGLVPDGHVGDLFLPDSLRVTLGLRDDRLRVARDAYVLTALLSQRQKEGRVILLIGKSTTAGDPLRPSRLLFRCPDTSLVARAQRLFKELHPSQTASAFSVGFKLDPARVPADCLNQKRSKELSPTIFRDYLACPLRFYLRHVLDMQPADDRAREPDAMAFGNIVHAVLEEMAGDRGLWACRDADRLAGWLEERARALIAKRYGQRPWLGVDLALDSAVRRLRAFAVKQAEWHAAGWEIVEREKSKTCEIGGLTVKGRIDRIDRNKNDGRFCVLDYKTTDKAKAPRDVHIGSLRETENLEAARVSAELLVGDKKKKDKRWADLQLPIYRKFVESACGTDVLLGYILLPNTLGQTGFSLWEDYTDELHASALACAAAVAARIKDGVFWPPGTPAKKANDDFAGLLLGEPQNTLVPPRPPWRAEP